jgi:TonB-linked SusC/RagA family outer membrane protein
MKKLTTSVLAVVLSSSFAMVSAQTVQDTARTQDIEGVVVTALGIKREKKALGYSTQTISAEDVSKSPTSNFTSNLSGKVAGLNIKQSGNVGGSVDVTLRGYRSMTGNNQPLFVIDGTPMLNNSQNINTSALRVDTGNTISDINPDDIAEINVLKGAAATALYGSRAQNGAIIITTKKGKSSQKLDIDLNSSVSIGTINKETFPTYQKTYGQGYGYLYGPNEDSQFDDYNGQPMVAFGEDASYGAAFDPNLLVFQYTAFLPGSKDFGKATPWVAAKHDPSYLFQTAATYNNSFSIAKGNDVSSFRLSYQNVNGNDILPNTYLNKNALTGTASYKIADNLTATLYSTYVTQSTVGKNPTGYHGVAGNFRQWWATNVDILEQRDFYMNSGKNYSWNIKGPTDPAAKYWDNPYFRLYENYLTDKRERFAGNVSLSWDVDKHINLTARASHDGYTYFIDERRAVGSLTDAMTIGPASGNQPSGYAQMNQRRGEENYDFLGSYKNKFFDNFLNFYGLIGSNVNVQSFYSNSQGTQGGLFIPGVYSVTNTTSPANLPLITDTTKKIYGVFAQANFGIMDTYYLDGTVRRDTSSALPTANNSYWYYSGSLSAVVSNWGFLKGSNVLKFGKLRASYAEVGNDTGADQLLNQYTVSTAFGTPSYFYNTTAKNPDLKPERTKSYEVGAEFQLFQGNRIGLDLSWYRNDTFDQILALPVTYSSGNAFKVQNVGNMRSEGFEVALNLIPVKTTDFAWELNANWSNPRSKVTELASGVENITLGSFQQSITINASLNDDFGTIKGTDYVYDPNGNPIIDGSTGKYRTTNTNAVIGNMQADWFGSLTNRFRYKQLELSFQIDWKQGGDIFSLDQAYGQNTGLYQDSVFLNDLGNPVRNPLSQGGGVIHSGVVNTGTAQNPVYTPNDIRIDASGTGAFGYEAFPSKKFVYDATYVKLREVAVTYSIPKRFLASSFVQGASFSVIGNNLWIIKKNLPFADPESGLSAGNVQGFQTSVLPTTRIVSFNVKLNF